MQADADAAVVDSGATLLREEFDTFSSQCAPNWQTSGGTADFAPDAGLDGGGACRICLPPGSSGYVLFKRQNPVPAIPDASYSVEVFMRDEVSNDAGSGMPLSVIAGPFMQETPPDAAVREVANELNQSTTWQRMQLGLTTQSSAITVFVRVYSTAAGDCILMDRLTMVQE